jgi:hypothetical protein
MIAPLLVTAFLSSPGAARAGIVLDSGSYGYSNFQVDNTIPSAAGSAPLFSGGELISPGHGLASLYGSVDNTVQTFSQTPISSNFISAYTNLSTGFGTARTDILATLVGGNGASSAQGGIYWLNDTTLADNLKGKTNLASVSVSIATASFTNTGSTSVNIKNPGALLSVSGTLGDTDSSSYVAAGLTSSFTLSGGGVTASMTNLGNIVLAANASGSISSNGGTTGSFAADFNSGTLLATASSTVGSPITLLPGETIDFTATLTLISDPDSFISITTQMASQFPTDPSDTPDFGIFAGGAPSIIPEPSTIVLLGVGLASAGLWARRTRHS